MSEDFVKVLKAKAQQFENNKTKSLEETQKRINALIDQLKKVEHELLDRIEAEFGDNTFLLSFSLLSEEMSFQNIKQAELTSKVPVPGLIYPRDEDMEIITSKIKKLVDLTREAPKGLTVDTSLANSLTISWDESPNATGYIAEMKKTNESDFHEIYRGTNTTTTVNCLKEEEKHQFRVRAVYGSEMSGWSDVVKAKPWLLFVPRNLEVVSQTSDSIKATWDEVSVPFNAAVSYRVGVQETGSHLSTMVYNTDKPTFTKNGLNPKKEYAVRVRAVCGSASSEWSNQAAVTTKPIKCFVGHNLEPYTMNEAFEIYNSDRIQCDNCSKTILRGAQEILYGCRICNYDLCSECIKKPIHLQRKECSRGHPLTLVTISQRLHDKSYDYVICDLCRKGNIGPAYYPPNYLILYCPICEYDICNECIHVYDATTH